MRTPLELSGIKLAGKAWRLSAAFALAAGLAAGHSFAVEPRAAPGATLQTGKAEVGYGDIAALTELKFNPTRSQDWMNQLSGYIASEADRALPTGERLLVTIDDVQLAGTVELRHRSGVLVEERVIRKNSPPKIDLTFKLTSATGEVLKSGKRELRDPFFFDTISVRHRTEDLRYEKNLIDDWMRKDLSAAGPQPISSM